jgi:hypothetical protein
MIKGSTFKGTRIDLDNVAYEDCTFDECTIVYAARGPVSLKNPNFINCKFAFEDAAAATVTFLGAMYRLAPDLIEGTFENIRRAGGAPSPPSGGWVTAG